MAEQSVDQLNKEIESLKKDITALTETITNLTKQTGADLKARLEGEINIDQLQAKLDEFKGKGQDALHKAEHEVKKNPLQSVAIAFGIGALLALVLGSRR